MSAYAPAFHESISRRSQSIGRCFRPTCREIVRVTTVGLMNYGPRKTIPWQERFWRYVTPTDGCWEWSGARNEHGYGRLNRGRAGEGTIKAHRASWEIHFGPIPPGLHVCHRCDNPPCVNPADLFLGTMQDNLRDAARKGRTGPQNGGSTACRTVSDEDVRALREAAAAGVSHDELSARFGVHSSYVSTLALGRARLAAGGPISYYRRRPTAALTPCTTCGGFHAHVCEEQR